MRTVSTGPTRTYGATATSSALVAIALILVGCQLFVIPLWLLPRGTAWGWLLPLLVLTNTPLWSLLHETIHGSLLRDRRWNDRLGRTLAVAYGAPFALLKAGHLLHHRFSRTPRERTEIFDPGRSSWGARAPGYYLRLFGGLYLSEVSSLLLAPLPKRGWAWVSRRLEDPETVTSLLLDTVAARRLGAFRLDSALIVALHAAAFAAYGPHWWMLPAALLGRAFVVSVADNAYHYATPLDEPLDAMNLSLPRPLETFILAFNLHGVHHRHPGLAWPDLRGAFLADGGRFDLSWWHAAVRQIRGPIPATADRLRGRGAVRPPGGDG
ncbi:fatty acid desaturase [Actinoplanes sp. L3-i22]|uniref:fatty acid desaturase family protein n=1 Tax=Actinoplanes sp. L3-i22 TaxID=2836373 RepID=UPI001C863143|nr:fatty acid desaturase [Actinoplanes sp. L3-i22]